MTIREAALRELALRVSAAAATSGMLTATRNAALGERVDDTGGWVNLMDGGRARDPVACLGGASTSWEHLHIARLAFMLAGRDDADRDAALDAFLAEMALQLPAGETLGGLVDLCEMQAVEEPAAEAIEFAVGFKVGEIPILLLYTAPTAAG